LMIRTFLSFDQIISSNLFSKEYQEYIIRIYYIQDLDLEKKMVVNIL